MFRYLVRRWIAPACFLLASVLAHSADLRVVAEYGGERFEVVSLNPVTVVRDKNGVERVLGPNAQLRIEGDTAPSLKIGYSPLYYNVERRQADYERHRRGGDLIHYGVDVSASVEQEETAWWGEDDLSDVWSASDLEDESATWLLGWWKRSSNSWTGELGLDTRPADSVARASLKISESAIDGRPVLFLWKDGRFMPPTKYAEAPENALFVRLQNGEPPPAAEQVAADAVDSRGKHWLSYAASWGAQEWVEAWIASDADERFTPAGERSPLELAAMHGHAPIIPALLKGGYRADTYGKAGFNPGHLAVQAGHIPVVEAFLANDFKVNGKTEDGSYSALGLAIDYYHDDLIGLLRRHGAKMHNFDWRNRNKILATHAARGNENAVKFLLDENAKARAKVDGRTMLFYGASGGNPRVVAALLQAKADPNPDETPTPLALACNFNDLETARLLLEAGADPNRGARAIEYPLHSAVIHGNRALVRLLLEHGASADSIPYDDQPFGLVEIATFTSQKNIVEDLFSAGAACRFTPALAENVLIRAISGDVLEMAMLAFEACVSPDFKFYDEYAPNWVADYYGADTVSAWLQEEGYGDATPPPDLARVAEVNPGPKVITATLPPYTEEMFLKYGNLSEQVEVLVDEEGVPRFPKLLSGTLPPPLVIELYNHLAGWRFAPAEIDGQPVKLIVTFPVDFTYAPPTAEAFELGQLNKPPVPIEQPAPRYPTHLLLNDIHGTVRIAFVVNPEGQTERLNVVRSTHPFFSEAVVEAVKRWRFEPGEKEGIPVHARVYINIPFSTRRR